MLSLLKIRNIALIDDLVVEFGDGLNLLTGETGSGKSIIIDSLGALTGERVSSDLIKEGESKAQIEGLFLLDSINYFKDDLDQAGLEIESSEEIIIKREISANGKNRVFLNNQLITLGFLKKIGGFLASIHGQGEQFSLFTPASHEILLDEYGRYSKELNEVSKAFSRYQEARKELESLNQNEAEKLQLRDILRFQTKEIADAEIELEEDDKLELEKKRLANAEKLYQLSSDAYDNLYESENAVISKLESIVRNIDSLSEYEPKFSEFGEGLEQAQAILEELSYTLRDYGNSIEYSPKRLNEIEERLSLIAGLKRKYGGSLETVLEHYETSIEKLISFETAEEREKILSEKLIEEKDAYLQKAIALSKKRKVAAKKFEKIVENDLKEVALEKARFRVNFSEQDVSDNSFTPKGIDQIEFYFSANPGETLKPLAKIASGGEASRLMLILKTASNAKEANETAVFDEIDAGIGGRVAEAVGRKLSVLGRKQQVLCVTHQPQVAALADRHFTVNKTTRNGKTRVSIRRLADRNARIEEVARMLAGENLTDTAREHARELIAVKAHPQTHGAN